VNAVVLVLIHYSGIKAMKHEQGSSAYRHGEANSDCSTSITKEISKSSFKQHC